jgi:ATP-dependent Clp protease ATP-binding subunit ClpC
MFERFTKLARHTIVLAQEEARQLNHNYIGTEHILLGLLGEQEGLAFRVLQGFGMSLEGGRQEVTAIVSRGKAAPSGHIPFTPRAKKTLELALREALQLHHNYIGTEHILLGLIREGDGVAAQILRNHGDLVLIRSAVLDALPVTAAETGRGRRWARRRGTSEAEGQEAVLAVLSASPAADLTLSAAARLAGTQPVGSHHLLLAALADPDAAASRALASLGVDLDQAKAALQAVDVTGTTDEQPEEAGRRQMIIKVADDKLTIELSDPVILKTAKAALLAVGEDASLPGTIPGDLPVAASLSEVWHAIQDGLAAIQQRAAAAIEAESRARNDDQDEASGG